MRSEGNSLSGTTDLKASYNVLSVANLGQKYSPRLFDAAIAWVTNQAAMDAWPLLAWINFCADILSLQIPDKSKNLVRMSTTICSIAVIKRSKRKFLTNNAPI